MWWLCGQCERKVSIEHLMQAVLRILNEDQSSMWFQYWSKIEGDSQAAWPRFQEVQGLHQLQAGHAYQEGPAERREGGETRLAGSRLEWKWHTLLLQSAFAMTSNISKLSLHCLSTQKCLLKPMWITNPLAWVTDRTRRSRRARGARRTLKEVGVECVSILITDSCCKSLSATVAEENSKITIKK